MKRILKSKMVQLVETSKAEGYDITFEYTKQDDKTAPESIRATGVSQFDETAPASSFFASMTQSSFNINFVNADYNESLAIEVSNEFKAIQGGK